uniref:GINS complex subunit 2 n=2 Tax=Cyanistes caeruleus TaxID=156563 RepID=A0A8C0UCF6_CYACU
MTGTGGTGLGEEAVQPPQEDWEGAVLSPTFFGVCAAPESWLGVSGSPGADQNPGSPQGDPRDSREMEFVAVTPVKHLEIGDLGPFNPGLPVEVPVWLAINLKQRQKCRLIPPEWMDVGKLEEIRDQERKEDTFTPMPSPYYMELTKLLLNYASDNIPRADEIRTLVKDTWDTRMAKLRLSADSFVRQQEAHAKLDNLTLMEINSTGTFLTQALDHMYKLRTNLQPGESSHSQDF